MRNLLAIMALILGLSLAAVSGETDAAATPEKTDSVEAQPTSETTVKSAAETTAKPATEAAEKPVEAAAKPAADVVAKPAEAAAVSAPAADTAKPAEAADKPVAETTAGAPDGEVKKGEEKVDDTPKPAEPAKYSIHRFGDMEVIALVDAGGIKDGSTKILIDATDEDLARAREKDALKTSINVFVVKMGGKTILFDTGMPIETTGGVLPALEQAGIAPDSIDAVVITHFHNDHIGGLVNKGKAVYPKAELYVPEMEVNKWSDPGVDFLITYGVRTNAFKAGKEIMPGIKAIAAYGHTPGHTIYRLDTGKGKLLIIGDLVHLPGVQLANPDMAVTYDVSPARAVAARKRAFDMAIAEGLPVAGMHIPFPGIGTLDHADAGYAFTEINK